MVEVFAQGDAHDVSEILFWSRKTQSAFRFSERRRWGAVPIAILPHGCAYVFQAERQRGVTISAWQSAGICQYAGLHRGLYLLALAMLGLTQWRALSLNPGLRTVDLLHPASKQCLFAQSFFVEEYALALESPAICPACKTFYGQLCPPHELRALETVVECAAHPASACACSPQ